jgi:DNA-binding MarR family transcriptional regulator
MLRTQAADKETGHQLLAFAQSLYAEGDPRVHRLMDELRKVSHQLYRLSETSLEESHLSYAQFRVLMTLLFNEWRGQMQGLNPSEISENQGTSRNTISALIRDLEEKGLIERQLDHDDRRRFNIRLTEAGRGKVRDHARQHMQFVATLFAVFDSDELDTLGSLLGRLNQCAQTVRDEFAHTQGGSHASSR